MTGTPRIVPFEAGAPGENDVLELDQPLEEAPAWQPEASFEGWDDPEPVRREPPTALIVTGLLIAAWTGFFAWANWSSISRGAAPAQWSQWLATWSLPVALVLIGLLLVLRSSRREGLRFTDIARGLREESVALETRLRSVNGELSLAREFIASQSRDLEALGRIAVERLSQNADRLAGLIHTNGAQIEAIAGVSANALENMDKLRGQLPVIANSAKDVTNNIGNAGRTAHLQLQDLANGFHRLNEFGQASERQAMSVREQVNGAVAEFARQAEQLAETAQARFAALAEGSEHFRHRLEADEVEALAAIRGRAGALHEEFAIAREAAARHDHEAAAALHQRIAALRDEGAAIAATLGQAEEMALSSWRERIATLSADALEARATIARLDGEAFASMETRRGELGQVITELQASLSASAEELGGEIVARRGELEIAGRSAIEGLRTRLTEIDAAVQAQRERHIAQSRAVAEHADEIGTRLGAFGETLSGIDAHSEAVAAKLDQGLSLLAGKLAESRNALAGTDGAIAALTEGSVRLLELIEASAEHTRTRLPEALAGTEDRLSGLEDKVVAVRDALGEAGDRGQSLSDYVLAARSGLAEATGELVSLHGGLEEKSLANRSQIAGIREEIAQARSESEALASQVEATLQSAIEKLATAARESASGLARESDAAVEEIAASLGERSRQAVEQAMEGRAEALAAELEAAVGRAAAASREAALHLRDQLARVDELAGNLERRVNHARERAEEQVDSDFSRRAALITESLNSAAIDIAKALSADVSDTAWAAYMRGDRGIFTRRAVALLDGAESRSVAQHYGADREFRENVNHYIHDFEAMLRSLLSTRDGNALSVTLLSSDMGKLYVALAQAIERLRA